MLFSIVQHCTVIFFSSRRVKSVYFYQNVITSQSSRPRKFGCTNYTATLNKVPKISIPYPLSQLKVALDRKATWVIDALAYSFYMLSMGICTTKH